MLQYSTQDLKDILGCSCWWLVDSFEQDRCLHDILSDLETVFRLNTHVAYKTRGEQRPGLIFHGIDRFLSGLKSEQALNIFG